MAVDTIGYAALQIIPSMDRMTGNMQAQFAPFVQGAQRAGILRPAAALQDN